MLLKNGSKGGDVKKLQEKLGLTADGSFGPGTEKAVKKWQIDNDLAADGIVGEGTWNKMFGSETNDRYNIEFHALWELQNWIGYNRFFIPGYSFGNLTLQGLTLGASLDF
jgi:peptidoglycan hydrolase-like protein with peptidoglycan-binding domain